MKETLSKQCFELSLEVLQIHLKENSTNSIERLRIPSIVSTRARSITDIKILELKSGLMI